MPLTITSIKSFYPTKTFKNISLNSPTLKASLASINSQCGIYLVHLDKPITSGTIINPSIKNPLFGVSGINNFIKHWKGNEEILYIGSSENLKTRIRSCIRMINNNLGFRGNHKGGWWLNVLDNSIKTKLNITFAYFSNHKQIEYELLCWFQQDRIIVPSFSITRSDEFPYANKELVRV